MTTTCRAARAMNRRFFGRKALHRDDIPRSHFWKSDLFWANIPLHESREYHARVSSEKCPVLGLYHMEVADIAPEAAGEALCF